MAIVRSQCGQCSIGCGIRAITGDERALSIEGDKTHPANAGLLCAKAARLEQSASLDGRLLHPLVDGRRQRWDRAIAQAAQRLAAVVARHGPGSVALHVGDGLLTEDLYVANKLMKGFLGSAHIHAPGAGAAAAIQKAAFGEDIMPAAYEDIDRSEIILLTDAALASSHPVLMERVQAARQDHGAHLIVLGAAGADIAADLHVPVAPGSAARLIAGLLLHCHDGGILDAARVARSIHVPDGFWAGLRPGHDLWSVARACALSAADVRAFYDLWTSRKKAVTLYPDRDACLAVAVIDLHLATGRIGQPGAAPFVLCARANAMGMREVGCVATQLAAHLDFTPDAVANTARFWGARAMARQSGRSGDALHDAMRAGDIKALWSLGDAPDDRDWLMQARAAVPLSIRSTARSDEQHDGWSLLLPSPVWAERDGTLTGADRLVSRQRRLFDLPGEARPDWWAMTRVAQAMGWGDAFHYERPADIYREHVRLTAYRNDGARLLNLKRHAPISNPAYTELTPWRWGEVPFDDGRFPTDDGRARLLPIMVQAEAATIP
ncbi:molybdopterin-dependent oxidoreductase [Sphingobium sp. HBC34]|uniref:Molybdopterin-dependent oxidoreductase n=1 Tax=Sphingobium cyanobacteriorum TaxID=3063954 RepID=A0ABT8ZPY4_9SPHN|nr:molybdopterin-dependent oxidoreductase [Sphingobium sp. HBC34]MDO7836034.1 molybdopterin-dependent oxidoreductase [Sphingobium sp. HBC34]